MGTVGSAVRAVNSYRRLPAVLGCSSGEAAPNLSFILIRRRPSLDRQTTLEFAPFAVLNSWHGGPPTTTGTFSSVNRWGRTPPKARYP